MPSFENTQGITSISMSGKVRANCPIGKQYYSGNVVVTVDNPGRIPDYCDVDKFMISLDGTDSSIEDVVAAVFDFVTQQVESGLVKVVCRVDDAVHAPVLVVKEMNVPC